MMRWPLIYEMAAIIQGRWSEGKVVLSCFVILLTASASTGDLKINVRNQGGEIIEETLAGNATDDFTLLEFIKPDGTIITHLVDFKNEVQIFYALVLGEEERGQSQYQVMCFISKIDKGDYITSDAIAKLRQKNPNAIRQPEEELPARSYQLELAVNVSRADVISPHIRQLCGEAAGATFTRHEDIRHVEALRVADLDTVSELYLHDAVSPLPLGAMSAPSCATTSSSSDLCLCQYHLCISWYPCGLKYCRGHDPDGQAISYRCGIRTCRRCHRFHFPARRKLACLWDELAAPSADLLWPAGEEEADV